MIHRFSFNDTLFQKQDTFRTMGSPSVFVALCMTLTLAFVSAQDTWMTEYRQYFQLACTENRLVVSLQSIHLNAQEDRVWNVYCGHPFRVAKAVNCAWMDATNDLDLPMYLQCPANQAIAGLEGTYHVPTRDRQYKVMCCPIQGKFYGRQRRLHSCELTDFQNPFDEPLNYRAPDQMAITGIYSYHSDQKEDRRFRFMVCRLASY